MTRRSLFQTIAGIAAAPIAKSAIPMGTKPITGGVIGTGTAEFVGYANPYAMAAQNVRQLSEVWKQHHNRWAADFSTLLTSMERHGIIEPQTGRKDQ